MNNAEITSLTLLSKLRHSPRDESSWGEFVDRYGKVIFRWCKHWGLQNVDAEDVTQTVLLKIASQMQTYEYRMDSRFRSWLKTIAYRAWCDFLRQRKRSDNTPIDDAMLEALSGESAENSFLKSIDQEFENQLFREALSSVQSRVEPHTFEAFRLTAIENMSGADVAKKLDIKVATVYVARSKVQKMLKQEVERIESLM